MAKAGRKRKIGVKREPNGREVRTGQRVSSEQDAMSVAINYRQKVFGISEKDVLDQKGATLLGRLCLQGVISNNQWQAGEDWFTLINALSAAMQSPRGFKTATSSGHPVPEDEAAALYRRTKAKFDAANDAVEEHAPVEERKARMLALRTFIVDEIDQPAFHGTLRTALNGLVRHFGLEGRKAA